MLHKLRKNRSFIAAVESLDTNVKKWKSIGSGSYGRAYDMGDGRVCKITTNKRETQVALKLKKSKKKYAYLYKILDVFFIFNKTKFKYGLIITPKYRKLTDGQKTDLYELFCFLDLSPQFRFQSVEQVKRKIKKSVYDYYYARRDPPRLDNIVDKSLKIFRKYDILYILRNLKAASLGPEDMHYDNILRDGDHFILIDIAC